VHDVLTVKCIVKISGHGFAFRQLAVGSVALRSVTHRVQKTGKVRGRTGMGQGRPVSESAACLMKFTFTTVAHHTVGRRGRVEPTSFTVATTPLPVGLHPPKECHLHSDMRVCHKRSRPSHATLVKPSACHFCGCKSQSTMQARVDTVDGKFEKSNVSSTAV
jgi:hypothetical protein